MKIALLLIKIIGKFAFAIISLAYLALAIAVILIVSYVLGHNILDGALIGNDSPFALSLVHWFERFYPQIPYWYPLQGMGVSMFHSYPMSTTFLVIWLKNFAGMSSIETFRILSFLTFPLTAFGIYMLAWVRLKNQTIALIAAIFFLLSQASWLFQTLHGIFAQSFSLVFIAPSFLFFDLYLDSIANPKKRFLSRIYFVSAVIFVSLTFLTHFVSGTMVTISLAIWGILHFVLSSRESFIPKVLIPRVSRGLVASFSVVIMAISLSAFWVLPFLSYTSFANREGLNTFSLTMLKEVSLRLPSLLGIGYLGVEPFRYDYFFFATPVLIFFAIGSLGSILRKNKKIQIFSILTCFFIFLTIAPIYFPPLVSAFKFFFTGVYFRGLMPALILLPIVAAWGIFFIPDTLLSVPFAYITKRLMGEKKNILLAFLKGSLFGILFLVVSIISLGIFWWGVNNLAHKPARNPDPKAVRQYNFRPYGPSLSEDFDIFLKDPLLYLSKKQEVRVNKKGLEGVTTLVDFLDENLGLKKEIIIDVSPFAAGGAIMQGAGLTNINAHFINLYHFFASLTHQMWGYQAGVFYGREKLYKASSPLKDLSDWYGIKYAILTPGFDPFYKYREGGWKKLAELSKKTRDWGFEIWENPSANGLLTVSRRPVVLVIGDVKKGSYDQVFRTANLGGLFYNNAWLVEGKKRIDNYSLGELKEFDGIILHGYSYGNKGNAWGMIKKYVEEGGRVFVDTGWQYVAKDWGSENGSISLPKELPVTRTSWSNIGTSWEGVSFNKSVFKKIDISKFDPPVWEENPWGMALSQESDLREGAIAILAKENNVLMAENSLGKGKIVWSGLNIFSHVSGKMNEEEARFVGRILAPLFGTYEGRDVKGIEMQRKNPDKVNFVFKENAKEPFWLLFRESYSPNWRARMIGPSGTNQSLTIFRGGPGFVLIKIPKANAGDKMELVYGLGLKDGLFAKLLSIFAVIFLTLYIPLGGFLNFKAILPERIKKLFQKNAESFKKSIATDDEDY